MRLLDNLASSFGYVKEKSKASGGTLRDIFSSRTANSYSLVGNQKQQLAAYLDWVYGATQAIAEDVATVDFKLYVNRTTTKNLALVGRSVLSPREFGKLRARTVEISRKSVGGETVTKKLPAIEEVESHPLLDLLHSPNPYQTKDEFFEMTVQHMLLAGESFWVINRNAQGMPVELWPLVPYNVRIIPDSKKFIAGYVYRTPTGTDLPLDVDDVIHHKFSNPNDMYRGMSVVAAAARAIDTDAHAADYNRKFFYNSAVPDGTLSTDNNLDDQTFKRLKDEWQASYGGTSNAHKVALLEAGLKFAPSAFTQKDMDFLNSRNFNRDQTLALFRMSKSILGLVEDSNRANMEAADYNHAKRTIRPKLIRIATRITEDLAPQFDVKLFVGFVDPVPEDKEFMLKEKQAAVNLWMTIDEIREMEGKDPLPDGLGSQLYVSNLLIPIGQAAAEPVEEPDDLEDEERPSTLDDDTDDDAEKGFGQKKKRYKRRVETP